MKFIRNQAGCKVVLVACLVYAPSPLGAGKRPAWRDPAQRPPLSGTAAESALSATKR